ncbi:class I mannose-6-phosphate isomerase [Verrucomicrobiaceae bacterium N1E253]|uniref:Class I mannose-6-phosphate isomerase n=2 Tax=Oceaniferula marina TaxID=2748318 RepID=A0A851GPS3_9BACT|nr:class I mannose-6-phosphate isomerase [Oceaniferula marina]
MERVWGGRELESVYGRKLPKSEPPYGESWEMTDRPEEQSVVTDGPYKGMTLGQLWQEKRNELFGPGFENSERFPLLIKILDARDDLSIQVHPPTDIAPTLNGEPKTEMWYIADANDDAQLYVGLKQGVSREDFQQAINDGTVDQVVHAIDAKAGDSIFIPSGRLHAIGAGFLIYEIQQNSDTTYRVFDWNRVGLDGVPRELHVEESMRCIDFDDIEPGMDTPDGNTLANCEFFHVEQLEVQQGCSIGNPDPERFSIVTVVKGQITSTDGRTYQAGDFLLQPQGAAPLTASTDASILQTTIPQS